MRRTYKEWSLMPTLIGMLALIITFFAGSVPALADNKVVTNCSNDSALSSLLTDGAYITFHCGIANINLSSTKVITAHSLTIDGGGRVTLNGSNARQLFSVTSGATLILHNITLTNGYSGGDGGAIVNRGTVRLENSTIHNSTAAASGGAIVSYGQLNIVNSLLEDNKAQNGGALYPRWSNSVTVIDHSVLRGNTATNIDQGYGGAILSWDGAQVTISNSDIYNNSGMTGGAIFNWSNSVLFISGTQMRSNAAGMGGAIYNKANARVNLTSSTFSGNSAFDDGGAIANESTATLTNVTISGNKSDFGGGIANSGTATLTNVTISGNSTFTGGDGGGISNNGSMTIKNTIVANNTSDGGTNCGNFYTTHLTNAGFNLSNDASCNLGPGQDTINVILGPLANNGGLTQTHMPQVGSPAIDHGSGCPNTDQRGAPRPFGPACDIGAVEYGAQVLTNSQ